MDDDRNDVEVTIDDGDIDSNDDSDKDCSFAFNFTVLIGDDDDDDDDEVENALQTDPKNRGVVSIVLIEEKHNNRNIAPSNCTAIIAVIIIVVVLVFIDLFEIFLHDLALPRSLH